MSNQKAKQAESKQREARAEQSPVWREPRFPWYGYLLINGIVWIVLMLIYAATKGAWFSAVESGIDRPGTAGILFIIAVCFALASIYDFFFDRYSERATAKKNHEPVKLATQDKEAGAAES